MKKELSKVYEPQKFEDEIYDNWNEKGYFRAEADENKKPFTIVIPPPNVTGQLHMGHALDETLQDILIRTKRMQGFAALWVPGTDHAGIATQIKVEEALKNEEGLTKHDLGREEFLKRVWDWKNMYGDRITNQLKKLGSSCDWSRERFTMDEGCSKAVREVFVNLYEKGLIYRGNRIINWCPRCVTALSDAEVEYSESDGHFWYIKYPVKDSSEFVVVATTRPETMLGDTAVAVNPKDKRYTHLVGKTLILPLVGREIPVIADDYVEADFGTGCVKITPAHDPNDFEVGLRHNLEQIRVMDDHAVINQFGGIYQGLDRYEARKKIIEDLKSQELLVKIEAHSHNVGGCYRCSTTVEPISSKQWFVKMEPLAKEAIDVVADGRIQFVPDRFSKTYMNWMENVHDWCISRQLWWGHRIPAFYCNDCREMIVSKTDITVCPKCGGSVRQEDDVLDTWFSSALWPFSTLGWPDNTEDLKYFYPTSVLVTGYDIIFFWVARMIFSGMEHLNKEPFKHVFIHGIVRDEQGRKMSKSLGNGIDPLGVIEQYGADALRFTLTSGNSPGNDMRYSEKKVEASRNFANKIWNASRFVLMNLEVENFELPEQNLLEMEDKWILSKCNTLVREVTDNIEKFELGLYNAKLYDFIWDVFCDWYVEMVKPRFYEKKQSGEVAQKVIVNVLITVLKLLHPIMPYITEQIYTTIKDGESIMISDWPEFSEALIFGKEEEQIEKVMSAIKSIRNLRSEMNVPPANKTKLIIVTNDKETFEKSEKFFIKLAFATGISVVDEINNSDAQMTSVVVESAQIYIPMNELVDFEKELLRLKKEQAHLNAEIERIVSKMSNESFVKKAPPQLVEAEKQKGEKIKEMLINLEQQIKQIEMKKS